MKPRITLSLLALFFLLCFPSFNARGDNTGWTAIATGIEYKEYALPGPNKAYVTRMDRSNPAVFIDSILATGELSSQRETVSAMASRSDGALNYWGGNWGGRNQVVVAINGDYLDKRTGLPEKGQIQTGWYAKQFNDMQGQSGFAWTTDRSAFIGQCVYNNPKRQYVTYTNGSTRQIDGLNIPRGDNDLILYTPQINAYTPTNDTGIEAVIELSSPLLITPAPYTLPGRVIDIFEGKGGNVIPFNTIVLSAKGIAQQSLASNLHVGDIIGITQEISTYESDCTTPMHVDWTSTYASVGGNVTFLQNRKIVSDDERGSVIRNPRTAIAYNDQYIFFVVVDGRQPGVSVGMTIDELGGFVNDTLGANWGISQDGGGSSTMVINGKIVNNPSDLCSRIYLSSVESPLSPTSTIEMVKASVKPIPSLEAGLCERPVANAMLMVVQQPPERSNTFLAGWTVYTTETAELRLGPGDNYQTIALIPAYTAGMINRQANGLDGILARENYWWQVSFGDLSGWVRETSLAAELVPPRILEPNCENPSRALRDRVCPGK